MVSIFSWGIRYSFSFTVPKLGRGQAAFRYRSASHVGLAPRPVERFLELRYPGSASSQRPRRALQLPMSHIVIRQLVTVTLLPEVTRMPAPLSPLRAFWNSRFSRVI